MRCSPGISFSGRIAGACIGGETVAVSHAAVSRFLRDGFAKDHHRGLRDFSCRQHTARPRSFLKGISFVNFGSDTHSAAPIASRRLSFSFEKLSENPTTPQPLENVEK
jgi:hypothetical protein